MDRCKVFKRIEFIVDLIILGALIWLYTLDQSSLLLITIILLSVMIALVVLNKISDRRE